MGLESKLRRKVKREIKAEEKQAKLDAKMSEARARTENNIARLEEFNRTIEENIKKYRALAKTAQKNNNKAAFNSYVAQTLNLQKLLDANTLMMVDAIRHADNQQINREMMRAQVIVGELVNPKLDIKEKEMLATREQFADNALNLTAAIERDEQFVTMFDDLYTGADTEVGKEQFNRLAAELEREVALDEAIAESEGLESLRATGNIDSIKEAIRKERLALNELKNKR